MNDISVVVLTHDDENTIETCLESVRFTNEIVIVDDFSSDQTLNISKKFTKKIYKRHLTNNFSNQRNFGISKAKNTWVLCLDSDEVISYDLQEEIVRVVNSSSSQYGYRLKRYDMMWGKKLKYGEIGDTNLLRLAKKNAGKFEGKVHEKWSIKGEIGELKNPLYHYPHQTLREFVSEINQYSSIRARELYDKKVNVSVLDIVFYPTSKFIVNFFFKCGFFDGIQGLMFAITMSFHSFLVRSKLWLIYDQEKNKAT